MPDDVLTAHIVRILAGGPRSGADLARRMGVPAKDLVVVLDSLVGEGLLRGGDPYELSDAGRARAQWSSQLLLGGPVDPTAHLDAAEQRRIREQEEAKQRRIRELREADQEGHRQDKARRLARARRRTRRWTAAREKQRQRTLGSQTQQLLQQGARTPVPAGTHRWWIEAVVQGVAGCCVLVGMLVLLIVSDHPDKVVHAFMLLAVGSALLVRAVRAHFGSP
jgi:hypothetical protein